MKTLNALGDLNISRVLRLIWQTKGISRIEIAHQLGIDKSTVTKIVSSLEEIGIIRAFAQGNAGPLGGRKPLQLEIAPDFGITIGIEISTDGYVATIVDLHGNILHVTAAPLPCRTIYDSFDAAMEMILPVAESHNTHILGVGVGIPAIVNTEKGIIVQSIPLIIDEEIHFVSWAEKKYHVQVFIENDARCGCLGEMLLRQGKGELNALFLLAEIRKITGLQDSVKNLSVGFGFVLHGQTYYGSSFSAGEFRSILWEEGNRSQFQSKDSMGELVGLETFDKSEVFDELARHVAFFVNMMNLDTVFLGGLNERLTESLRNMVSREILRKWPFSLPQNCTVVSASLAEKAVAYGAAGHCIMRFFALPNIYHASGSGPSLKEALKGLTGLTNSNENTTQV